MKVRGLISVITIAAMAVPVIVPYTAISSMAATDNTAVITAAAVNAEESALKYKEYDDHAEVVSCNTNAEEVVIPKEYNGLPVTGIGGYAFYACSKLRSVTIPDSITSIGQFAFHKCDKLESVTLPSSVKSIGYGAFYCCNSLKSMILPDSVTDIQEIAFYGCPNLISVTVMNPKCRIALSNVTFSNGYGSKEDKEKAQDQEVSNLCTIYGYSDSTAELYADEYGYKFQSLDNNPAPNYSLGDIDGDGMISASDATEILVAYSALSTNTKPTLNETQMKFADVNGDGHVDASDASDVLVYYSYTSTGGNATIVDYYSSKKN